MFPNVSFSDGEAREYHDSLAEFLLRALVVVTSEAPIYADSLAKEK
jgi:hypothetical protein